MASTLVIEALETLHKELDRMQPAIKQVEIAEQVIAEAKKIPDHYLKLVTRVEEQEVQFKQNLARILHDYADQIREDVNALVTQQIDLTGKVVDEAQKIPEHYSRLVKELEVQENQFKQQLSDELHNHARQVREELGGLVSTASTTIINLRKQEEQFGAMRKSLEPLVSQINSLELEPRLHKLQETADSKFEQLAGSTILLRTGVKGVHDRLDATEVIRVNHLAEEKIWQDQLDTKANAIQNEVRQLPDKFITLETTLTDQIRDQGKNQDERISALSAAFSDQFEKFSDDIGQMNTQIRDGFGQVVSHLELLQKQQADQKTYTFITWILIAAATAVLFFIKYP